MSRDARLKELLAAVDKKCGEGTITVSSKAKYKPIERISSGLIQLDYALGGGWPKGRISLLTGSESSCKSRLAYAAVADAQKRDRETNQYLFANKGTPHTALWLDLEGVHTNEWAKSCGVNTDRLLLARPSTQEEACEIMLSAIGSNAVDMMVLDSVDALVPSSVMDAGFDETSFGTEAAKNNAKLFRKLQSLLNRASTEGEPIPTCIFINQRRLKIQTMGFGGPKSSYPGGDAQRFYSSVILELSSGAMAYGEGKADPVTRKYYFNTAKNKTCAPMVQGEFEMAVVDRPEKFSTGQLLDYNTTYVFAEQVGLITHEGSKWFCKGEEFKTKKAMMEVYFKDQKQYLLLKQEILAKLRPRQ